MEDEIGNIKTDIGCIKKSQKFQSGQFESHKQIQENIQNNYVLHEKKLLLYEYRIMSLEREVLDEKLARNYMENNSRKMNIEVTGIPTTADENCKQIIYKLWKLIKIEEEHLNNIDVGQTTYTH